MFHCPQLLPDGPEDEPARIRRAPSYRERPVFAWCARGVSDLARRIASPRPLCPQWMIYTDAASNHLAFSHSCLTDIAHLLLAAYYDQTGGILVGLTFFAERPSHSDWSCGHWSYSCRTGSRVRGACCWVYLDRNNKLAAIIRGDSKRDIASILVARFRDLSQLYGLCVWHRACVRRSTHLIYRPGNSPAMQTASARRVSSSLSAFSTLPDTAQTFTPPCTSTP